ncbi:hypothetical protein RHGRI_007894 [Rhododendron griersonianum]|uniref:Uncharacterized protein n=2 Tax=Rhododendron griersonianum TaxID=479676 RepID=A0AAV6KZW3_9ERIC|nr:hypothetical protein RHGRI_007894 [Rhododendron griersonianum]
MLVFRSTNPLLQLLRLVGSEERPAMGVRKDREQDTVDPISCENMGIVGHWVMEKEGCSEDFGCSDWMTVDPSMGNTVLLRAHQLMMKTTWVKVITVFL